MAPWDHICTHLELTSSPPHSNLLSNHLREVWIAILVLELWEITFSGTRDCIKARVLVTLACCYHLDGLELQDSIDENKLVICVACRWGIVTGNYVLTIDDWWRKTLLKSRLGEYLGESLTQSLVLKWELTLRVAQSCGLEAKRGVVILWTHLFGDIGC